MGITQNRRDLALLPSPSPMVHVRTVLPRGFRRAGRGVAGGGGACLLLVPGARGGRQAAPPLPAPPPALRLAHKTSASEISVGQGPRGETADAPTIPRYTRRHCLD